jgi:predicted DCC family thiol-disulfide oxidoreductase YuxK
VIGEQHKPPSEDELRKALEGKVLVLYAGVCGLCNRTVQFALRRDRKDRFRFSPLQGELAQSILDRHGLDSPDLNTVYVIENPMESEERLFKKSRAVFRILQGLGGFWGLLSVLRFVPLDWAYDIVARNRYKWFGKYDACPMPSLEQRSKILLDESP